MKRKPPAWSFSSLDTMTTCARKYYEERITKSVVQEETAAQAKGTRMHKEFEDRLGPSKVQLPVESRVPHESFMKEIESWGGQLFTERRVGLNKKLEPCDFFAKDVWWRGVVDVQVNRDGDEKVTSIVDYKTGKKHDKVRQLHLFSLYAFLADGAVKAESMFYWTETCSRTRIILPRTQIKPIMQSLLADLTFYTECFKHDQWPPKQNYLCKSYCGVVQCEFHGRSMQRR